jgi:hypothetical protein
MKNGVFQFNRFRFRGSIDLPIHLRVNAQAMYGMENVLKRSK